MKKLVKTLVAVTLFLFVTALSSSFAECPVTDCSTACAEGTVCQITQYENGVLCSTTVCHGKGYNWDDQQ